MMNSPKDFCCDKLCPETCCQSLRWVLKGLALDDADCEGDGSFWRNEFTRLANEQFKPSDETLLPQWNAIRACVDPTKLVALFEKALWARGVLNECIVLPGWRFDQLPVDYMFITWKTSSTAPFLFVKDGDRYDQIVRSTSSIRFLHVKLLAITLTAANESSRDVCDLILQGKQ